MSGICSKIERTFEGGVLIVELRVDDDPRTPEQYKAIGDAISAVQVFAFEVPKVLEESLKEPLK